MSLAIQYGMILIVMGQLQMNQSRIKQIKYLDIFTPPAHYLDHRALAVDKCHIDKNIIDLAIADAKISGREIEFYKAILDSKLNVYHYLFYIKHHDDLFCVYTASLEPQRLIYTFSFSPN